jgi:hypothetical protein
MQQPWASRVDQIVYKNNVPEGAECETAVRELVEAGCDIIFANSFGHENYMVEVAAEYPDIQFCHATGYLGATDDLANTHNYFASIYEARYLAASPPGSRPRKSATPSSAMSPPSPSPRSFPATPRSISAPGASTRCDHGRHLHGRMERRDP